MYSRLVFSDESDSTHTAHSELLIWNLSTSDSILVKVIPVGFIFKGDTSYNPKSKHDTTLHIYGGQKRLKKFVYSDHFSLHRFYLNHDYYSVSSQTNDSSISWGKYKIEFWKYELNDSNEYEFALKDSLTIDYGDSDYPYSSPFTNDFFIYYYSYDNIRVKFANAEGFSIKISSNEKTFEIWNQKNSLGGGNFKYRNRNRFYSNNRYIYYPLHSKTINNGNHISAGVIFVNLEINHNIYTCDTLIDNPTNIDISKKAYLKINPYKIFTMATPLSGSYTNLIVEDSAFLNLGAYAKIIVESPNRIILKNKSNLIKITNSEIIFNSGSLFCNEGARIIGQGSIIYKKGYHQFNCSELSDFLLEDSTKFILEDSAIVNLPNITTLHIRGNTTSLILKPESKLLFGENSSIVCDQGGKVIANNATFASSDSTKKWNGISLSGLSQDTIKNCLIKNAMYGISISDKYDAEDTGIDYSAEISGCTFINQTNYVLNSAVYIAGSNNVLIMNNSVSSSVLEKGYTHGIYAEYCPEGVFNLIGNDISGAGNGMTLIGCSPFAAQNILTGNEYSECGMFLDNSNGTFEYNEISDFYCSYFSYYSSPDLLKNVFDNYHDDNLWLSSSSVPVMHPLINAGSVYWYAGDNTINGSPSNACLAYL